MSAKGKGKYAYLGLGSLQPYDENGKHTMPCRPYRIWRSMVKRTCNKPWWLNNPKSKYYRGVSVCEEWRHDFGAFWFWAMQNGYGKGLTLQRIDKRGDFCPENCRWAMRMRKPRWLKRQENAERRAGRGEGVRHG